MFVGEVRFDLNSCDALIAAEVAAADRVRAGIGDLSPLVAEAHRLLEWIPHPNYSPLAGLYDAAIGLTEESRDLDWRVEFVRRMDGEGFPDGGVIEVQGMPNWTYEQAQRWYAAVDIEQLWDQREDGSIFEQQRTRDRLEELIAAYLGTDDPAAIAAVIAGLREGEQVVVAAQRAGDRMQQAAYNDTIGEFAREKDLSFEDAEDLYLELQQQIVDLVAQGYSPVEAANVVFTADAAGLDVGAITEIANDEGIDLATALSLQARGAHYEMTVAEVMAFDGLNEHFPTFDNATGGDRDGLVSLDDLRFVVNNPDRFDIEAVAAASALLTNSGLLTRLDTGRDNGDVLNDGDAFGDREFDDGKISQEDILGFEWKQGVNALVGTHYDNIDVANGGELDGHLSKADFEAYLDHNRDSLSEDEIRALSAVIDGEFYDKGWLERNKRSIAIAVAVVAGVAIAVGTGGLGSGVSGALITMAVTGTAGAAAAGGTTIAINGISDESTWDDDVWSNAGHGFIAGMAGGGLGLAPTAYAAAPGAAGRFAVGAGVLSDGAAVVGMGGADWALDVVMDHEHLEGVREVADGVSIAAGVTGLTAAGVQGAATWYQRGMLDGAVQRIPQDVVDGARTLTPQGVTTEAAEAFLRNDPVGQAMHARVTESVGGDHLEALRYATDQVRSGVDLPTPIQVPERLVKVVPLGEDVSGVSPYWLTPEELDDVIASRRDLTEVLGLPYTSHADQYEIWEIVPLSDEATVVRSVIAPTDEFDGLIGHVGGAEQIIVSNRTEFGPATATGIIVQRDRALPLVRETLSLIDQTATAGGSGVAASVEREFQVVEG